MQAVPATPLVGEVTVFSQFDSDDKRRHGCNAVLGFLISPLTAIVIAVVMQSVTLYIASQ